MGRAIHYWVNRGIESPLTDEEWGRIEQLQGWYNRTFTWTAEDLALERVSFFPRWKNQYPDSQLPADNLDEAWTFVLKELDQGVSLKELEQRKLVVLQEGGYRGSGCLASGYTTVYGNEWNAFLVLKFLIETSLLATGLTLEVKDEGPFIRADRILLQNGKVTPRWEGSMAGSLKGGRVFSVVDPERYSEDLKRLWSKHIPEDPVLSQIVTPFPWDSLRCNATLVLDALDDLGGFNLNLHCQILSEAQAMGG